MSSRLEMTYLAGRQGPAWGWLAWLHEASRRSTSADWWNDLAPWGQGHTCGWCLSRLTSPLSLFPGQSLPELSHYIKRQLVKHHTCKSQSKIPLFCHQVCWLLNIPATCQCISGTDLLRQFYVLPYWDRCYRSNFPFHPVTVYRHWTNQSQYWPFNTRRLAG